MTDFSSPLAQEEGQEEEQLPPIPEPIVLNYGDFEKTIWKLQVRRLVLCLSNNSVRHSPALSSVCGALRWARLKAQLPTN